MEFQSPEEVTQYVRRTGRKYVNISFEYQGSPFGGMLIELFTDIAPQTCEHFIKGVQGKLHGGYGYLKSPIHRVVKGGYIQGGDVIDGTGKGAPDFTFPDETFAVKHDDIGLIGLANNNEAHTASTQFYITLKPVPWLDGKRVLFGKVIDAAGLETLKKFEDLPSNNERPLPEVNISAINLVS